MRENASSLISGSLLIEPASPEMLPELLRIEEACFSAPWSRKMFEAELTGNPFARFLVARLANRDEMAKTIVGYLCFWIVFDEVRLMNLAVIEAERRRGIATALVSRALGIGMAEGAVRAMLEVRASNHAARALYERMGFRPFSTRARYYTDPVEDAVLMYLEPLVVEAAP
jgi:ribosomal-protein-alanine N-acetyltransferase